MLSQMRDKNIKFDFPPISNASIYQSLDFYNSKPKHLREEWHIKQGQFEGEEDDSIGPGNCKIALAPSLPSKI